MPGAGCVRTIVVWKLGKRTECQTLDSALRKNHSGMETTSYAFPSQVRVRCVRTIVVWKLSRTYRGLPYGFRLRKNHSGMETSEELKQLCFRHLVA